MACIHHTLFTNTEKNSIENGRKMMKLEHFFKPQVLIEQPNTILVEKMKNFGPFW